MKITKWAKYLYCIVSSSDVCVFGGGRQRQKYRERDGETARETESKNFHTAEN